jgi:hypothetical protein
MNGLAELLLHFGGPKRAGRPIRRSLEIAKLMPQAKLKDAGRRFQLRAETIAAPNFGA